MCSSYTSQHTHIKHDSAQPPELLGEDVGHHTSLSVLVLGFTDVVPKVDGLQVLDSQDALGDPGGVAHPSVDQPQGHVDVNWTVVLHNETKIYYHCVVYW